MSLHIVAGDFCLHALQSCSELPHTKCYHADSLSAFRKWSPHSPICWWRTDVQGAVARSLALMPMSSMSLLYKLYLEVLEVYSVLWSRNSLTVMCVLSQWVASNFLLSAGKKWSEHLYVSFEQQWNLCATEILRITVHRHSTLYAK
jgi:hypothetical protein